MIVLTDSEIEKIFSQFKQEKIFANGAYGVALDSVCFRDLVRTVEKAAYLRGYNKARQDSELEKYAMEKSILACPQDHRR